MKTILDGVPEQMLSPPPGIVSVKIDKRSGKLADGSADSRMEYFIDGTQPTEHAVHDVGTTIMDNGQSKELF
jgi:penicillin-binding protein 1A